MCLQKCQEVQYRQMFDEMPKSLSLSLKTGKIVHAQSLKLGISSKGNLGNVILDLYSKCGHIDYAERVFLSLEERDKMAWNSIMFIYSRKGFLESVLEAFGSMWNRGVLGNQFSCAIVLSACAKLMELKFGKQVHCGAVKMGFEIDAFCEGALIDMYAKCGYVVDARKIFDGATDHDTVSCTAMISGYVQGGLLEQAMEVFEEMRTGGHMPDQVAFVTTLNACVRLGRLDDARQLFSQMRNPNIVAWNVLISGHVKGGHEREAIGLFQNMIKADFKPTRSTLGSLLSAIAYLANYEYGFQEEEEEGAFSLFRRMMSEGIAPDEVSLASILSATANLQDLNKGTQVHCFLVKYGLERALYAGGSLIDFYCKCGIIGSATEVFSCMTERSVACTNALIAGYAQVNLVEALNIFQDMLAGGLRPSEVTFATLLESCTGDTNLHFGRQIHCSILKLGFAHHDEFIAVSLLGMYMNAQKMTDANVFFSELPYPKSTIIWTAMISGSIQNDCCENAIFWYSEMCHHNAKPDQATFASVLRACSMLASLEDGRKMHSLIFRTAYNEDELIGKTPVLLDSNYRARSREGMMENKLILIVEFEGGRVLRRLQSLRFYDGLQITCIGYTFTEIALEMTSQNSSLLLKMSEKIICSTMKTVSFRGALATGVAEEHFAVQSKLQDCQKQDDMLHNGDREPTANFHYKSNNEPNGVARNHPCR
ncbi:unnamed protein product [Fraxinus pennsylvanica]|uniref:Pentatricopeptide repeat-containing protein n=1 Tax=Fraxinus pennsylvanica TaxID=56036 RepID=A0AAD1YQU1_9LAMI|nr:unnamed protein product [Fraxinus pennsylvanica]